MAKKITQRSFEPGAMSIIQMGEQLIGHPTTAVNELVKNAYDADALNCKIYFFYDEKPNKSFAVVFDDGTGMNNTTLFGSWLQPSVSVKREKGAKSSIYHRQFLGSKGIGRLAAMALGESVSVITKQKKERHYNWITINRELFKVKKLLSQIKFPGDSISDPEKLFTDEIILKQRSARINNSLVSFLNGDHLLSFEKGTLIVIERLDDSVLKILSKDFISATERLDELFTYKQTEFYKALATLITPFTLSEEIQNELVKKGILARAKPLAKSGAAFDVKFGINLLPNQQNNKHDWQNVDPIPIHSVFDYRFYGKVARDGSVRGYFVYDRIEGDSSEEKFDIPSKDMRNESEQMALFQTEDGYSVGEYYFDIRIYDIGEAENLDKLAKKSGFENKSQFRSAFKSFQGLRVSKNGFGVKPYGEEVDDWIGLSKERVQDPGHNVNTNQILGYVFLVSPENDSLEERTNREGFLENTAFIQLKDDLGKIFKALGVLRYNYRAEHGLGRVPESRHQRPDFKTYLDFVKASNSLAKIRRYSEGFMKEVTTSMDNLEESLTFSERLASLGSGIELVYHEIAQPISGLKTTHSSLGLKKDRVSSEIREDFIFDLQALSNATDVLAELRKSLQPAIGKSRVKTFKPHDTFIKVSSLFKSDLNQFDISVKVDDRLRNYELESMEYAFWIAFLNIFNNAVYWIKYSEKPGQIRLNIKSDQIIISNTGPLIDRKILNTLFEYGVTTKKEKGATGLGLAFTRSILSRIDWEISAANTTEGPVFTIKRSKS